MALNWLWHGLRLSLSHSVFDSLHLVIAFDVQRTHSNAFNVTIYFVWYVISVHERAHWLTDWLLTLLPIENYRVEKANTLNAYIYDIWSEDRLAIHLIIKIECRCTYVIGFFIFNRIFYFICLFPAPMISQFSFQIYRCNACKQISKPHNKQAPNSNKILLTWYAHTHTHTQIKWWKWEIVYNKLFVQQPNRVSSYTFFFDRFERRVKSKRKEGNKRRENDFVSSETRTEFRASFSPMLFSTTRKQIEKEKKKTTKDKR